MTGAPAAIRNALLEAALAYAARELYVFPLRPRDKRPLVGGGFKVATIDPDKIRAWWTATPDANIGLDCGRSGLVVIDVDAAKGGLQTWGDFLLRHKLNPITVTVRTGGGGLHVYYRALPGVEIRNSAGKLGPGLDVRGAGGYVVLPPSIHPNGELYAWIHD